ncbi:hypothetical protein [Phenylobacterium sp.]|jgi:hypothetical protein|uniref:hypothetical protein n=1 Tax=Phenylobacterium sp. TaxID=1871053 RepID=UPI002F3F3445
MTAKNQPSHEVFVVTGETKPSRWIRVGAAFANHDGKGFTVKLDALPLDGKIVLRVPEPDTDEAQA